MRGSLSLALLGPLLLLALPPPEDELSERLREEADPDPWRAPNPREEPVLRRLEERLTAPAPIVLRAPPEPPEGLGYYYPANFRHRGKRRRPWPGESTGAPRKNQRQRRRDARRKAL